MHADEDAGFDLVSPNGEVRVIGIDNLFRIDLGMIITSGIWAAISNVALAFSIACSFQAHNTIGPGKSVAFGLVNILRAISSMTLSSFFSSSP
jgi:hypothetical protein